MPSPHLGVEVKIPLHGPSYESTIVLIKHQKVMRQPYVAQHSSLGLLLPDSDFELATGSHRTHQYLSDAPNPIPRSCFPMEIFELEHNGKSRTGLEICFSNLGEKFCKKNSMKPKSGTQLSPCGPSWVVWIPASHGAHAGRLRRGNVTNNAMLCLIVC